MRKKFAEKHWTEKVYDPLLEKVHDGCHRNKARLKKATKAACFYCCKIFNPKEIKEWVGRHGDEAICPHCHIDTVLPHEGQFPLTKEFLKKMYEYWFCYYIPFDEIKDAVKAKKALKRKKL